MAKYKNNPDVTRRANRQILGVALVLVVIIVMIATLFLANKEQNKVISVIKVKEGIPANAMVREDMLEEYKMYYKEFEQYGVIKNGDTTFQALVTWNNREQIIGKVYAGYYLRPGTVLFWDNFTKEQTKKNSYLYYMTGELLNIKMNPGDFGDMVVPGDILNIRCKYTETVYDIPSEEAYQLAVENELDSAFQPIEREVNEMLFSEVTVLDMLNSSGSSIFDIYYSFVAKPKSVQQQLLKDSTFLSSVQPDTILLEVTSEEADRFMELSAKNPTYMMTLLPRTTSNSIIDSLSDIQDALSGLSSLQDKE
jgi:hypothetical protein